MTTGLVFGLIVLAHVARLVAEGMQLARDPWFVMTTVLATGLCLWALRLLRQSRTPR